MNRKEIRKKKRTYIRRKICRFVQTAPLRSIIRTPGTFVTSLPKEVRLSPGESPEIVQSINDKLPWRSRGPGIWP
jgi:hypothetical protein